MEAIKASADFFFIFLRKSSASAWDAEDCAFDGFDIKAKVSSASRLLNRNKFPDAIRRSNRIPGSNSA